jgi:hypothetical protein
LSPNGKSQAAVACRIRIGPFAETWAHTLEKKRN